MYNWKLYKKRKGTVLNLNLLIAENANVSKMYTSYLRRLHFNINQNGSTALKLCFITANMFIN